MTDNTALPTPDQFLAALDDALTPPSTAPESGAADSPMKAPTFRPLSEIVGELPEGERHLILQKIDDAILDHGVSAVPLTGGRFSLAYRDTRNRRRTKERADKLVLDDDKLATWLARQRAEAQRALMLLTGDISMTIEEARMNPDRAMELADLHREYMKRHRGPATAQESKGAAKDGRKARAK